jgi:chromosomal replication initiation ATPase DnaA
METENVEYPHLLLRTWPFTIVPDEESCKVWADRNRLKTEIETTFTNIMKTKVSQIAIFWAWYGTGKTHSLMHYHWKLNQSGDAYAVYTEFPQNARKFLDLYVTFSENLDFDRLQQILVKVFNSLYNKFQESEVKKFFRQEIAKNWSDFETAAEKLAFGTNEEREAAERWIKASPLKKREREIINVSSNLTMDDDAVKLLSCLTRTVTFRSDELKLPKMLIWMIDEFNRIDDINREDYQSAIRTGIHKVFNRTPKNFCFVLACSTRSIDDVYTILGDALKDRLSVSARPMRIDPLHVNEAIEFIKDILRKFRPSTCNISNDYFPFTIESVNYILSHMLANNVPLTPRKVMDFHGYVLQDQEDLIKKGKIKIITPECAASSLDKIPRDYYKI